MEQISMTPFTVLYVEDDDILREEVVTFLRRRYQHVLTARDGKEGFEKFEMFPVDFIITDLKMPVMDGLEMASIIRQKNKSIPIIITTAMSDVELMQASIETGVDGYLIKPVNFEDMTKTLEKIKAKLSGKSTQKVLPTINKTVEKSIESDIAKLIKQTSGKGPEKVQALVHANLAEIIISGSRTQLENTLLATETNIRIGDYVRDIFYQQIKGELEKIIYSNCEYRAVLQTIKSNSKKDVDIIKFIIEF